MASSRPTSMIISASVFDETNTNGSKTLMQKKETQSLRLINQPKLPINNIIHHAHSSSSSIDSTGAKNAILLENKSLPQVNSTTTISSTTTDSEYDSEQEERYIDDNNLLDSNNLPIELKKQKLSSYDSSQQKLDENMQEQLSRRDKHFRKLFKSDIPDDMPELIDSYVCAYQGDILLQGKMYITDRYLCFHSRIISYVTKHVYRWEQIENVTKERVAFIFPTAIGIQLKRTGKKVIYASFLQRDQAFDKILSICSRFSNDTNSYQDDEENGTLRTINSNNRNLNDKMKKSKRDIPYDLPDEPEHDDVLQMCLRQDKTNTKRLTQTTSLKSNDDRQQQLIKKFTMNSDKKKFLSRSSNVENVSSNNYHENNIDTNESRRHSRSSRNQEKQTDTTIRSSSVTYRQSNNTSLLNRQGHSRDRTMCSTTDTLSNLSHSNIITENNSTNDGLLKTYVRIITLSIISIIKLFIEYLLLLYNQFKLYPIKTSLILLIFILILTIHSFYLIKLAYRIEDRLQTLHHKWSSSSASMKNSLPSTKEF